MSLLVQFADALKLMRHNEGLSQLELALRIDSRQSAISLIENAGANPTLRKVEELSSVLGYEPVLTFKKVG